MFKQIKNIEKIEDGDILFLEKKNMYLTGTPIINNIVIVGENTFSYLVVEDYGGYTKKDEIKGVLTLIELFNKWERIICIGNVYSDEWKRNIDLI
jgi:hypothetical protein